MLAVQAGLFNSAPTITSKMLQVFKIATAYDHIIHEFFTSAIKGKYGANGPASAGTAALTH